MKRGVIIKLKKNKATLMTQDCTFCEVKTFKGMYEGMEICFNDGDILKKNGALINNKSVQAACFAFIIICSYLFLSFYQENIAAYAYVGIDINPSIEIVLNKKGKIIKSRGLDADGKTLLNQIDIKKMDSMDGVKKFIEKTISMGYLNKEKGNDITVYAVMEKDNNGSGIELAQKIKSAIKEEVISHNINKNINALVFDKKSKDNADKMGISITEYIKEDVKEDVKENAKTTFEHKDNNENENFDIIKSNKTQENKSDKKGIVENIPKNEIKNENKNINAKDYQKEKEANKINEDKKERKTVESKEDKKGSNEDNNKKMKENKEVKDNKDKNKKDSNDSKNNDDKDNSNDKKKENNKKNDSSNNKDKKKSKGL